MLYPYEDWRRLEKEKKRFFLIGATKIFFAEDEDIASFRELYGLPARKE